MTDLLTVAGLGQRAASFEFELLDKQNSFLGSLDVEMSAPPSVSNNINRSPKRTMSGLSLPPSVTKQVNTLTDRVKPWMLMQDGTRWPLGVFLFADASRDGGLQAGTGGFAAPELGYWTTGTMSDQLLTVDQGSRGINFYGPGKLIFDALVQQLTAAGIVDFHIDPTSAVVADWVVWKPNTSRLKVINDLLAMAGFYSLYFDNNGTGQCRKVPALEAVDPAFMYGPGGNVFADTIVESDDQLTAYNSYVAVNSSFTASPIWGEWRVPASAENSYEKRGFYVVKEIDQQGLQTNAQAAAAAKAFGLADYASYRWVNFSTAIDPRRDTFDVCDWLGDKYRAQGWDFELVDGADMKHSLRRIWSDAVAEELSEPT
jgi:hypothetical protein